VAHVVVDVPAREIDTHFDYAIPEGLGSVEVGSCVLVDFSNRPVVGYVVGLSDTSEHAALKPVRAVLSEPFFDEVAVALARWISEAYLSPLSESVRLFTPPGGTPKAVRADGAGEGWVLRRAGVGPVDDRWAFLGPAASEFRPRANATLQRAVLDALSAGPVRVAELAADLGSVDGVLKTLGRAHVVTVERRRRLRDAGVREKPAPRHERLSAGQAEALDVVGRTVRSGGGVVLLDGVTGSGKTEVYLRAIEEALELGGTACVLVPEISLTPQTVGRFRTRFGDDIAVLHSRLSAGERYDQWDSIRSGAARIVVGARSALFAPLRALKLIVIDEEHEFSYKQGSAPRYHARDVATQLAQIHGAALVLGSATPSMESLHNCEQGRWIRVAMPERVTARSLPPVHIVDMGAEFAGGHRSMFSRALTEALMRTRDAGSKAVLLLNRRGFASFLLCRECGFVPSCDSCSTSLTYHEVGSRLMCHHCGSTRPIPARCPRCSSPYLRQFGAGTQRVENELRSVVEDWPIVRMDADTTQGKGAHERLLAAFEALESGVLLGTQMIAKGLDYPEVTLVGVISADVTLNIPDFRAAERTYQLLEQVAGRAGRGEREGEVIIQTYWPDHPAIRAVETHDPTHFYAEESSAREALGYPPYGRLVNVLVRGRENASVAGGAEKIASALQETLPASWKILGPSPCAIARVKGVFRWHVLVKAPEGAAVSGPVGEALRRAGKIPTVISAADVDPVDLL
jgi:primosomal protein N' (replication factor Y)